MRMIKKLVKKAVKILKKAILNGYYCFFYYHKKINKKRVLFESRNGLDVAGNIFYLLKEAVEGDYKVNKIYLSVCPQTKNKATKLLKQYGIKKVCIIRQGSFRYYKILATVGFIFTDTSLPRAFIKKEGQIFVNTWHGTPLKKMGKYNISERHSMGNIQRNLLFSDYLIFPNDYMREKMLESYNIDSLYSGEVLLEGYPRNSVLFNSQNSGDLKNKLGFKNKELFVYMPTWKAENMGETMAASLNKLRDSLLKIDALLSDNQVLLLKLHPLIKANANVSGFKHIKAFPDDFEAYEVLSCCDALVTDYSSVFFDFACSRKKIVLFTPDEEGYIGERGFYFPLSELPFTKTTTEEELISALNQPKNYDDEQFVSRFCTYDRPDASKKILNHILNGQKVCKTFEIKKNDKQKVLFYCGALLQNGITAAFKNLLNLIDLGEREYYLSIKQSAFEKTPERINGVFEKLRLYSLSSGLFYTPMEAVAFALYYKFNIDNFFVKHYVNRAFKRDFKKHFTGFKMDYIVNFSGYDKYIIPLLEEFDAKRIIFVHSDMEKELEGKTNQHAITLKKAYRNYDKVAVVTKGMKKPTVNISKKEDNIVVVGNSFDYKRVINGSNDEICFQRETRSSIHHTGGIEGLLSEKATKIITVGRYSFEKQHEMLIDAFDEYHKKNPQSFLIIIGGSGKLYNKTVAYANSKESGQNIACLWSVANPMPIIKRCDLFVLPSKYEALGLVMFEADALGVPVVCTEMEGPKQILSQYGGKMVKNSKEGILNGIKAFEKGEVVPMNIDFEAYNQEAISQFENLFM